MLRIFPESQLALWICGYISSTGHVYRKKKHKQTAKLNDVENGDVNNLSTREIGLCLSCICVIVLTRAKFIEQCSECSA